MTNPPPPSAIGRESEPLAELHRQQSRYSAAHDRLMNGKAPPARPARARPTSPLAGESVAIGDRIARLFPGGPIIEVSRAGNPIMEMARWKAIVVEVAAKHGFTIPEMLSQRRDHNLVVARHEAFYRVVKETSLSLPQIGVKFGGKDHTTILHGVRQHAKRMAAGMIGAPKETING